MLHVRLGCRLLMDAVVSRDGIKIYLDGLPVDVANIKTHPNPPGSTVR
ncbi:MAG: hypothetical protein AAFX05_09730 [Planctomycetota bacterium]